VSDPIEHDETEQEFRLQIAPGTEAHLSYSALGGVHDFQSTYVPPGHRGKGIASRLVQHAMDHARANGWRVRASCSYVQAWLARHPDYRDALSESKR
jgi:predicted GNAT family acetyltransferase